MTRAFCRLSLVALCATCIEASGASGPSPAEVAFEEARLYHDQLYDQIVVERKTCEEALARGVAERQWTDEVRKAGVEWLDSAFAQVRSPESVASRSPTRSAEDVRFSTLRIRLDAARGPTVTANPACAWFMERVDTLFGIQITARTRAIDAALNFIEEVWLDARGVEELAPAVRAINSIEEFARPNWMSAMMGLRSGAPAHFGTLTGWREAREAVEFQAVIRGAQPFLLPNPDTHPAEFFEASRTWDSFVANKWIFIQRPRVAAHYWKLKVRYLARLQSMREKLNELILKNAPAADCERALQEFPEKPDKPGAMARRSFPPTPGYAMPGRGFDYREVLAMRARQPFAGNEYTTYAKWLKYKLAEELGSESAIRSETGSLRVSFNAFHPKVAEFLKTRVVFKDVKPSEPNDDTNLIEVPQPPSGDPIQDIIAVFERTRDFKQLAEAWQRVKAKDSGDTRSSSGEMYSFGWNRLTTIPGNVDLLSLRDRAVRQALYAITNSGLEAANELPLETVVLNALEKAFSTGSKDQIRRILLVDRAGGCLAMEDYSQYQTLCENLPDTEPAGNAQAAGPSEQQIRNLLNQSISPAAARYAAEQWKKSAR